MKSLQGSASASERVTATGPTNRGSRPAGRHRVQAQAAAERVLLFQRVLRDAWEAKTAGDQLRYLERLRQAEAVLDGLQ